jgi:alpha-beta hydrolase superfamily lysophospholipase
MMREHPDEEERDMAEPERFEVDGADGVRLAVYRWEPAGAPRGIVQVAHGVGEHAMRYRPLAEAAADRGYVVVAYDSRAHGNTAASAADLGVLGEDGWAGLVGDIGRVAAAARAAYPGLKLALVAHSLGSFAAQQFLLGSSDAVDAVVLSGTAAIDLLEPAMDLDAPMDLSAFNAPFQPARTDFDWLSRDESQVDAYIADPWCGFGLDAAGTRAAFAGARALTDPAQVARMRADQPVHITGGEHDPVNGGLALVNVLVDRYRQAGLTDVSLTVWPGARHEVFNETNRDEVVAEVLDWIDKTLT